MKDNIKIVKKLGAGAVSDCYLTEDGKALLVGVREDSFSYYQNLLEKINLIKGNIKAVNITDDCYLIEPNKEYPFGAFLENCIEGSELKNKINTLTIKQKKDIGKVLSKFIEEIQSVKCNLNKENEIDTNLKKYEKSLNLLKDYVSKQILEELILIKTDYENFMRNSKFCLTHGDLQEENILIDDNNKLAGIIDFANMEYYVSEVDFAQMMDFDDTIFNAMLNNFSRKIEVKNILLVKLVMYVRHFKHLVSSGKDKINEGIKNIINLLDKYIYSNKVVK